MSIISSLARCWLTRSFKPFVFTNNYDEKLVYSDCENLGLYIHIPFCKSICDFCPYCKEIYSKEKCDEYINALLAEIRMVGEALPEKKNVTSLYFGGGTPALAADRLGEIIDTVKKYFVISDGIGAELHPDNVCEKVLTTLKAAGVTRISIGIQSFGKKFLSVLGRQRPDAEKIAKALKQTSFETVSMDFIFALPNQTVEDLKSDIETAFSHGANHIAIYPFIDFSFTDSKVPAMKKSEKHALLDEITEYCRKMNYRRDSIWTFSNDPTAKYSSMTRETFLGFGCSAVSLLRDTFKINTFSVKEYCERVQSGHLPTSLTLRFSSRQRMVYWLFWTAYATKINSGDFEEFFGEPLKKAYGFELWAAKALGYITESGGEYQMTDKGAFYYHYFENLYTLSYIDKMWRIMRLEAFPEKIIIR